MSKKDQIPKCWYCSLDTLAPDPVLKEGWYKCTGCGATWHQSTKTAAPVVTYEETSDGKIIAHPRAVRRRAV